MFLISLLFVVSFSLPNVFFSTDTLTLSFLFTGIWISSYEESILMLKSSLLQVCNDGTIDTEE